MIRFLGQSRMMMQAAGCVLAGALAIGMSGCTRHAPDAPAMPTVSRSDGHLTAHPGKPRQFCTPGERPLGLGAGRDGILFVPETTPPGAKLPLVLLLHGAGGAASGVLPLMRERAARDGFILLAPDSRDRTWDLVVGGGFGADVPFINQALEQVFGQCAIDPNHLAIAGFSDGASYALTLGLTNGNLFSHVMAFSPGFMQLQEVRGKPSIFVSHGTRDPVLPHSHTRHMVDELEAAGYSVRFRDFDGGHRAPPEMVAAALRWFR